MQGEGFRQLMSNPDALSAMMQIQQGMMRLQATSPSMFGQPGSAHPPLPHTSHSHRYTVHVTHITHTHRMGMSAPPPSSQPSSGQAITPDRLQEILSQIMPTGSLASGQPPAGRQPAGGAAPPPPGLTQQQQAEVVYRSQLEQLANMGFSDRQRNITGRGCGKIT